MLPSPLEVPELKNDLGNMDLHPFRVFTEVLVVLAAF